MSVSTEQWCAQGRFTRLLGHEIFYIDTGEIGKPVILLLHGFPTSSWDWVPIWNGLGVSYRLVALDLLGFGFSDKPNPHTYSIMEVVSSDHFTVALPTIGHYPHVEAPKEVLEAYLRFLNTM